MFFVNRVCFLSSRVRLASLGLQGNRSGMKHCARGRPGGVGPPSVNLGPPNISESKRARKVKLKKSLKEMVLVLSYRTLSADVTQISRFAEAVSRTRVTAVGQRTVFLCRCVMKFCVTVTILSLLFVCCSHCC